MQRNTIDLFMWGFQQHMLVSFQGSAESLFRKLDYKLDPRVFFIGILVDERNDRHQICLEPEDCGFSVHSFSDIKKLAGELENVDEEKRIFHSHEIAQENHNRRIAAKSYIEAINKILKRDDIYGEKEYFIASPRHVEGFLVFTILSLNKSNYYKYYSLTKEKQDDRFTIDRSLIESSINTFLKECSNALKDPNNSMRAIDRKDDELLRDAGRQFMYTVSAAGRNFSGLHGFYDACNEIASMRYEGAVGLGKMIVASKDHKNIKINPLGVIK